MKKISCLLICILGLVSPVFAASYQAGDWLISAALKTALPGLGTDWGEVNVEDQTRYIAHDAKLGTMSIGAEIQSLYFVTPRLAAGLNIGAEFFGRDRASGWEEDVSTFMMNYMAAARIYVNPDSIYKIYVPVALGAAHTRITVDMHPNETFSYTGFATHFGAGVERAISDRGVLGFEVRYNINRFHDSKVTEAGNRMVVYPRANYISYLLRLGYRF